MNQLRSFFCPILFSSSLFAQKITVVTESFPPVVFKSQSGELLGAPTQVDTHLLETAGVKYTIKMMNWDDAYNLTLKNKNYAIYATARIPERENLFKWVGPVEQINYVFFAKQDRNIQINKLDDAKAYRVACYKGDVMETYLKNNGFKKLVVMKTNMEGFNALLKNKADLWIANENQLTYFQLQNNMPYSYI